MEAAPEEALEKIENELTRKIIKTFEIKPSTPSPQSALIAEAR